MKSWLIGAVIVAIAASLAPDIADAKRLGGGKSSGLQRNMPERTAPDATPAKPAAAPQSPQAVPGQQATAGAAAAPAAAAAKRSWLGPIAGLAAGLGLAALMSHLGLGEAFANFLMLALLVVAAIALVAFVRRRMSGGAARAPALAGAAAGSGTAPGQAAWPTPRQAAIERTAPQAAIERTAPQAAIERPAPQAAVEAATPQGAAFVPAAFDSEGFERVARAIFIRMQAANDSANLADLRQFTTPEMYASLKLELMDRGPAAQTTEVKSVEARVVDVAEDAGRQIVSVRYRGEVIESAGAPPVAFDEVWHLVKPLGEGGQWAIAGIEQMS
jgi:predicted lipid-binding transport protein (Tim44 family)